jgi:hypothetical protein
MGHSRRFHPLPATTFSAILKVSSSTVTPWSTLRIMEDASERCASARAGSSRSRLMRSRASMPRSTKVVVARPGRCRVATRGDMGRGVTAVGISDGARALPDRATPAETPFARGDRRRDHNEAGMTGLTEG